MNLGFTQEPKCSALKGSHGVHLYAHRKTQSICDDFVEYSLHQLRLEIGPVQPFLEHAAPHLGELPSELIENEPTGLVRVDCERV